MFNASVKLVVLTHEERRGLGLNGREVRVSGHRFSEADLGRAEVATHTLKIKWRFGLILAVLLPSLVTVGWAGIHGLQSQRTAVAALYTNQVLSAQQATDLGIAIGTAHAAVLELLLDRGNVPAAANVATELLTGISSGIDVGIAAVEADSSDSPSELASVGVISKGWNEVRRLDASGALLPNAASSTTERATEIERIFDPMTAAASSIVRVETAQARTSYDRALASYRSSVRLMLLVLLLALLLAGGVVLQLIRSFMVRTLEYSTFARAVIAGDYTERLTPRSGDELDELGVTLDQLAQSQESEEAYETAKMEFTGMMQLAESEREAHDLLKRHLERAISASSVTVLNRNNSADRLEAVTALDERGVLVETLRGAQPRSCLAVRMARPVAESSTESLMPCSICSSCADRTTCTPLLVGGEVIGSVLVNHEAPLHGNEERSVREAVAQSAPVLGNLRNLAIAELRAATDSLTGLPNRRALQDAIKRMVAQASRTVAPLAALMCDLDHFKEINDRFGHGRGDDVLAAVGAALIHTVRVSDFVGRYGGEEFLVLLPATGSEGAVETAERLRSAIAEIRVPDVERGVTMSIGIAVLPDHAIDGDSLERSADRALYAAKNAGRDRVEVFSANVDAVPEEWSDVDQLARDGTALGDSET